MKIKPNIIINAAAYTKVDEAEDDYENAYNINSLALKTISECALKQNATLVHYSTDYVFDGNKKSPYTEDDICNPISKYGVTKLQGEINIISKDSRENPKIKMNYLSSDEDRIVAAKGLRLIRKIVLESNEFKQYEPEEFRPGTDIQDDEELVKAASNYAQTIFHPVGTCKMGNDENSVVSDELKVHGIENLRVIDASVMPNITSGNTNAPTIMIAEKGADMILNS